MKEKSVLNNGVTINYLYDGNFNADLIPLLIIPGLLESAENYKEIINSVFPRPCIAITLRGRGKSGSPKEGYTLYDHIQDIEAVVKDLSLGRFVFYGYSRGVSYMLGYAVSNPERLHGMIIGEYPAEHKRLTEQWLEQFKSRTVSLRRKKAKRETNQLYRFAKALQKDSHEVIFWEALQGMKFPVLVLKGSEDDSLLTKQDIRRYKWYLPKNELCVMDKCGHNLYVDKKIFVQKIKKFCEKIDPIYTRQ